MLKKQNEEGASSEEAFISELKAIKRLLALLLLRDGAGQQQVARAAGVATLAINQLANVGAVKRKTKATR